MYNCLSKPIYFWHKSLHIFLLYVINPRMSNSICNSCLVFKCQNLPALEILALHLQALFPIIAQAFSFFPTRTAATKKTPETSDYLRSSRSPNLRLDYNLIKSGPFMFQDIYLPCDTAQIMRSSERLLPELLPDERSVHGTVSRIHSQDRCCCRILQSLDLHHARHRYLRAASD